METRQSDHDGSDIFWPGYVDATTNLILNLLFLLTILIIAVFMFALEMGRSSKIVAASLEVAATEVISAETPKIIDYSKENIALKREIEHLKMLLAKENLQKNEARKATKVIEATTVATKPRHGLDKTLASDFELIVRFKDEAIAFTRGEHDRLIESLKPVVSSQKTSIYVEVPAGFSEAKRMGFYRAMAVRNLLIEMKIATENIDVAVLEVQANANASLVKVSSR